MNLLNQFKEYLFSQENKPSKVTVKNYLSDINHFVHWFESISGNFVPKEITRQTIAAYKVYCAGVFSQSSTDRHFSSLRKFFTFLKMEGLIVRSPFEQLEANNQKPEADPYGIKNFKNFLYVYNASHLTIKNYLIDIKQFFVWAKQATASNNILEQIDSNLIEEYKQNLLSGGNFSPATINRKLSSLRKYLAWAQSENLINSLGYKVQNTELQKQAELYIPEAKEKLPATSSQPSVPSYSAFPPIRMAQKISNVFLLGLDGILTNPLAVVVEKAQYSLWKAKGQQVFTRVKNQKSKLNTFASSFQLPIIKNLPKESYAPLEISTKYFPWYKKTWFQLKYHRPQWYKTYHSYSIVHYFHFAILIIFLVALSFGFYNVLFQKGNQTPTLAAALPVAPPRVLSFQGRLTDNFDNPISTPSALRFAIYTDATATDSGTIMAWQEVQSVTPDQDGIFNVLLGSNNPIPSTLFTTNPALWLGVTVGQTPELTPRQQLATVAYATNAETLQGLLPITASGATQSNVVLALNSQGNLVIGGSANPTFQATGGQFKLSGQPLLLTTNVGSNGNVQIAPDGMGYIDLQKPLVNTTNNNNIAGLKGAIEIDDMLGILATSSVQSALTINQNGGGLLINASASGITKFMVDSAGNATISGQLVLSNPAAKTTFGGIAYAWPGTISSNGYVLSAQTNGQLSWIAQGGLGGPSFWQELTGALSPINVGDDLLLGGSTTASAKFAFINMMGSGAPTASISGNLSLVVPTGSNPLAKFNILNGGSLNIQTSVGGDGSLVSALYIANNGNVGIGNSNPQAKLDIGGATSTITNTSGNITITPTGNLVLTSNAANGVLIGSSGNAVAPLSVSGGIGSNAALIVNQLNSGDLLVASASGTTRFEVTNAGFLMPGTTNSQDIGSLALQWRNIYGQTVYSGGVAITQYWQRVGQALMPLNITDDFLLGSNVSGTASAQFSVTGIAKNQAVASLSGNLIVMPNNGYGGNVGIGTTSPSYPLDLLSTSANQLRVGYNTSNYFTTGVSSTGAVTFAATGASAGFNFANALSLGTSGVVNGSLTFNSIGGAIAPSISVDSSRNLNITAPSGQLVLSGTGDIVLDPSASNLVANLSSTGDFLIQKSGVTFATFSHLGQFSMSGAVTGKALSIFNETGDQNIFVASASGVNKFILDRNGALTSAAYTNAGGVLFTSTTGLVGQSAIGTASQCLLGGTTPAFGSCSSGGTNYWNLVSGLGVAGGGYLTPINSTADILFGGQSTVSADFAFLGLSSPTFQTIASFSGQFIVMPNNGYGGNVGIGTTSPTAVLDVAGAASVSGSLTFRTGAGNIQTTAFNTLNIGGVTTGNIVMAPFNGIAGSSVAPNTNQQVDLGTLSNQWRNIYGQSIYSNGTQLTPGGFWNLVSGIGVPNGGYITPINSTADLLIGGQSTASADFAVLGLASAAHQVTASVSGNLVVMPNNGYGGNVGIGTTGPTQKLDVSGKIALDGTVIAYRPTTMTGTLILGDGGTNLLHTAGSEGYYNTFVGLGSGNANTTGHYNTALGNNALYYNTTGNWNTALGMEALYSNTTGNDNTANGNASLYRNTTGNDNTANGYTSLYSNTTGNYNTANGVNALFSNTTGSNNTANGTQALYDLNITANDGSGNNTALGYNTGRGVTTGVNNTILGANVTGLTAGLSNNIIIADGAGNRRINVDSNGNVGIGTTSPLTTLDVRGNSGTLSVASISGQTSFASLVANNDGGGDLFTASASGTTRFVIQGGGNVGIGTVSPTALLDVNGNASLSGTLAFRTGTGNIQTTANNGLWLGGTTTGNIVMAPLNGITGAYVAPNTNQQVDLGTLTNQWRNIYGQSIYSNGVLLTNGGNNYWNLVSGIGVPNGGYITPINSTADLLIGGQSTASADFAVLGLASAAHQVTASVSGNLVVMPNNGYGGNASISGNLTLGIYGTGAIQTTSNQLLTIGGNTTGDIQFKPGNSASSLYLSSTGNVGIGTNNPGAQLEINKSASGAIGPELRLDNPANTGNDKFLISAYNSSAGTPFRGALQWTINSADGKGILDILAGNANSAGALTSIATFLPSGFVGIGTAAPTTTLDVNGNASLSGTLAFRTGTGNIQTTANNGLWLGGTTTGNIVMAPLNGITGAYVAPNTNQQVDLGTLTNQWRNIYAANFYQNGALINLVNYWQRNLGSLSPANITDDLLLGGTSTTSAKFAFINMIGSGAPTASISGNLSLVVPTGSNPLARLNILNGGTLNIQTSVGGDGNLISALFIANNGNVGIGNSNPQAKLDIGGATSTITNTSGNITITPNANLIISSGSVGIGTTNPLATLDVRGIGPNGGTLAVASISGQTSFAALATNNNGFGDLFTASASGITQFVIKNNGNVGIGINNPTNFKLQVAGNIGPNVDNTYNLGASGSGRFKELYLGPGSLHIQCQTTDAGSCPASQNIDYSFNVNSAGTFGIGANLNSSSNAPFNITQGGSIGINTITPLASLDLRGNSATTPVASISGNTNFAALVVDNSGSGDLITASSSAVGTNLGRTQFLVTSAGTIYARKFVDLDSTTYFLDPAAANTSLTVAGSVGVGNNNPATSWNGNPAVYLDVRNATGFPTIASVSGNLIVMPNGGWGGQVGIGTTSPEDQLSIGNGTINSTWDVGTAGGNRMYMSTYFNGAVDSATYTINRRASDGAFAKPSFGAAGFSLLSSAAGGHIEFYTSNTPNVNVSERMRIDENGNVGIGLAGPGNKLTIATAGTDDTIPSLGANGGKLGLFRTDSNNGSYGMIMGELGNGNGFIQVQRVDGTATAYSLLLNPSGGNVGIGVTTVNDKLDVGGGVRFDYAADQTNYFARAYMSPNGSGNANLGYLGFDVHNWPGSTVTPMVLTGAGNVGIGTTSPFSKLSNVATITGDGIKNASTQGLNWQINESDAYAAIFDNVDSGYGSGVLIRAGGDKYSGRVLLNVANTDNTSRFIVKGDGTVGIGTTGPLSTLSVGGAGVSGSAIYGNGSTGGVYGNSASGDGVDGHGTIGVAGFGTVYDFYGTHGEYTNGAAWTNGSSRVLKENFTNLNSQVILGKILQLPITEWNYISTPGSDFIGPMAEDFYALFGVGNSSSIDTVSPAGLALIGIKALNENLNNQQVQIASLSANLAGVSLTSTGDLNLVNQNVTDTGYTVPHYYTLNDALGNPISRVGTFSDAVIANLRVGLVNAQQVTTNTLSVATENITINGQNIRDYIAGIVSSIINSTNNNIASPIASADEIHTNFISPIDNTSNIALDLGNSKLTIRNGQTASSSAVAVIDNQGNASFSGQLSSNSLNTNEATISGTLHVGKIIADQIVGASNSASVTNVTNIYNSTPSGNFPVLTANLATGSGSNVFQQLNSFAANHYIDISSYSGQLAYVDNLSAGNAAFSQGLMVFGQTSLSDTSIVGQLSIDGNLILANGSVNVLGSDLNLQPLRQGGLSVMAGLFYIDTDGNLKVGGNANFAKNVTVNGTLAAGIISPLPGNDLNINLGSNGSSFAVNGASNSAVLSVNPLGDLVASGAATIAKLNLSLVQPALAVSPTEVVATGSAGTAGIAAYNTQVTIDNPSVTAKSLIYITPTSSTNNQVLYLLRQVPGFSFTVGLQNPNVIPIPFNWIIVN